MSLYIKLKNKETAAKLLEHILTNYNSEITAYSINEDGYDISNLPPDLFVDVRSVSRRGGSLTITISSPVRDYLNLKEGDLAALVMNKKIGKVYLEKIKTIQTSV